MTSSTAGPQHPEVLTEIEALFSWNPPFLIHTTPPSVKKPPTAFYDKHFSSNLILEKIERLPSLVQDLARNVDTALEAASNTLPPLNGFITAEMREVDMENLATRVTDERGVVEAYRQTTARYCSPLASTLALHPTASFSKWRSLVYWTQSAVPSDYGIPHGALRFIDEGNGEIKARRAAIVQGMQSETRRIFEEMRASMRPLATWEMNSTSTGSLAVMAAIRTPGKFVWTKCDASDCDVNPQHQQERDNVTQVTVGHDAQAPPWSFPVQTSLDPETRDEEIDIPAPLIVPPPATPQRRATRSAAASGSSMQPPPPPSASKHVSPLKEGKKRKLDDDDEAYKDRPDLTAQSLVQQAWAQAVRVDGTVIILHSGNYELVCLRHRRSQTLYISDLIEPPTCANPGYGKLHVGIYIAAIQDAMDRHQQPPPTMSPKSPGGGDFIGGDKSRDDRDHNRGSGSGRKGGRGPRGGNRRGGGKRGKLQVSAGRNDPSPGDELVAIKKTIHMASNRDVILLYLQYDIYDSPVPALFLRSAHPILAHTRCPVPPFFPRAIRPYRLEQCLTIVLTSEIGRGATGVVHRGTLKPEISDGAVPLDVVVKLAFNTEQRDALRDEYEVYRHLRSKEVLQGIATVLGFFDYSEDGVCALVMLYAGVPLVTELQRISVSDRKSALLTLKSIHRAGILHGDIRLENILMGDSGVTIIDFGHSKHCDDQEAKDKEFARLRHFLRLAHESD
ncbi:hypothetical protein M378DRAFT_132107 [Amanita muscaria Koide BX008]|uniref:Protein kinase domain-containing protein n=1 Tax=Amanita muscaria (strain Koide BX008) TaxID=946122 RepID=A0A0C2WPZ3_AMAMK|nr:hypothetical protein M378DRAFT_132107 [Amanita muscaria Koide BX008]